MHTTQTCILEQKIIICPTLDARSAESARFGYLTSIDVKQYEHELLPSLSMLITYQLTLTPHGEDHHPV